MQSQTLGDLFLPCMQNECQVQAELILNDHGITFSLFSPKGDIGDITLPLDMPTDGRLLDLVKQARYIIESSDNSEATTLLEYLDDLANGF